MFKRFLVDRDRVGDQMKGALHRSRATWFSRLRGLLATPQVGEEVWEEVEEVLLGADVGVSVTLELVERVRQRAKDDRLRSGEAVFQAFKEEMAAMLQVDSKEREGSEQPFSRPLVILVVGVNGSGKSTSLAKLAHHFQQEGKQVLLAAADTFRAAAIEQLQVWGQRLGAQVVAHRSGADPGAVVYDAYQAAASRGADVLLVDTAGRLHTKTNLMEELKKIKRVLQRLDPAAPHQTLLVLDATTGQNGLSQARAFQEAVGCEGVFLAKLDGTAKGGIVLAIARELRIPVRFVGTGEGLEDLTPFDAEAFVEALFSPETAQTSTAP